MNNSSIVGSVGYLTIMNGSNLEMLFKPEVDDNTSVASPYNDSDSLHSEPIPAIRQPFHMILTYSMAYGLIFILALVGNIIVITVVCKNKRMHTLTNFFIVNLAIADVLVAVFCIPITFLGSLYNGWRFGAFLCKLTPYMQGVSVCASVNTLAAIAIDRYLAICYTLEHMMTWRIAKFTVVFIWMYALSLMVPWLLYFKLLSQDFGSQVFHLCSQKWPKPEMELHFFLMIIIVCYLLPLFLIIVCYCLIAVKVWTRKAPGIIRYNNIIQRSKVKVIKMMALIVVLFGVSWFPLYALFAYISFDKPDPKSTTANLIYDVYIPIAQWLSLSNSGINPLIYCFFSKSIRKRIVTLLSCKERLPRTRAASQSSSTRFMSVDYTNGQITLRLNTRRKNGRTGCDRNLSNKSAFYD